MTFYQPIDLLLYYFCRKRNTMKFNTGDKVKFLNSRGGGIVSKIISPTLVNVMIEDGFEIPTMTSELVLVDPKGKAERMFDEDFGSSQFAVRSSQGAVPSSQFAVRSSQEAVRSSDSVQQPGNREPGTANSPDRQSPLGNYSFRAKNTAGVYLAFVPHDQKWMVTGMVEIYLVNYTKMDVLYAFFLEGEKKLSGKDYDVLFAGNKILIDTIDRDELLKWTKGIVQVIFFNEDPDKIYMPVSSEFDISPRRFNDENNYKASQFMEERLLLVSLAQTAALAPSSPWKNRRWTKMP